ncbi:hypothetical protein [Brevundimonas sp. M20]|uniref:hypothetical protein n=1 Tax=Brevundimonas sp. M20 TaxID=2591463 RepID=UPI0011466EE9|nr:hypothetical protein [Brevundimonas sp. M20]QDH73006.1 hypothetical protein FKQ52_05965 [Brevundimonas sp. M20]
MTRKTPKSPQEKKALSYANDCRNTYGESDKASRKAIPARKAGENRQSRRKAAQALGDLKALDEAGLDLAESSLRHDVERVGGWRKAPDEPLSAFLKVQAKRRSWRDLPPSRTRDPRDA